MKDLRGILRKVVSGESLWICIGLYMLDFFFCMFYEIFFSNTGQEKYAKSKISIRKSALRSTGFTNSSLSTRLVSYAYTSTQRLARILCASTIHHRRFHMPDQKPYVQGALSIECKPSLIWLETAVSFSRLLSYALAIRFVQYGPCVRLQNPMTLSVLFFYHPTLQISLKRSFSATESQNAAEADHEPRIWPRICLYFAKPEPLNSEVKFQMPY